MSIHRNGGSNAEETNLNQIKLPGPREPESVPRVWGFQPGKSGNPGGKNPERERLRKLVLEYGEDAIKGIVRLAAEAQKENVRLDAYRWLAEQCIGKARQEITGPDGEPITIDRDTIRGILADIGKR